MTDPVAAEFERLYRDAGGTQPDPLAGVQEVFAAYQQARVFASELHTMFASERARSSELANALIDLRESHHALEMSERRFRTLVSNSSDAVLVVGASFHAIWASASTQRVWGRSPVELVGSALDGHVDPEDRPRLRAALARAVRTPGSYDVVGFRIDVGGEERAIEAVIASMINDASVGGLVLNTRDVTERQRLEGRLRYQAYHDALTSLPNRFAFLERLEAGGISGDPSLLNVLMADVDGFKAINDGWGHEAGDQALIDVGAALAAVAGRHGAFIARLGGDEFGVLLETDALEVVARLAKEMAQIADRGRAGASRRSLPSVSVGWASSATASSAGVDLVRAADLALDQAKREPRSGVAEFNVGTMLGWADRLALQAELPGAADRGELVLHYQPIFDVSGQTLRGAEALVRWQHPTRGLLQPGGFIPLAERAGSIVEVGAWALNEACRQLRVWGCAGAPEQSTDAYLSVNVSTVELREPRYAERVAEALRAHQVSPQRIQLEVTESVLAQDPAFVVGVLSDLKALGVRLAIDDFGTGYSSLGYLATMPVDAIKVDRSFVVGMLDSPRMASVVRATISLAATLGLSVVAEGVETEAQRDALGLLGCKLVQGYLYSRPVPESELTLRDSPQRLAA